MNTRGLALPLRLLLSAWLVGGASAQQPAPEHEHEHSGTRPAVDRKSQVELPAVTVRAAPVAGEAARRLVPRNVLDGIELDEARGASLGQTVANVPGVQAATFGQGASRPVIRGLDGPRVAVLSDGLGAGDVSALSQDHAVGIEPFLADRIEILKGPSALLYGAGAIGGAVNVLDGRIPQQAPVGGLAGRVQLGHDSAARGNTGVFRIDAGNDAGWVAHADGMHRRAGDYAIPHGRLRNSQVDTDAGALGASLTGEWGYVGLSVARYLDRYGNPAEPGDAADGSEPVRLRLQQTRYDLKGAGNAPLPGIERIEYAIGHTDYQHIEFEGAQAGTRFSNLGDEARVLLWSRPVQGWLGGLGMQASRRDFAAVGAETVVPPTLTRSVGLFALARRDFTNLDVELGARSDRIASRPDTGTRRRFAPSSLSAGLAWRVGGHWRLSLNLDRAQRAPAEQELYAHGPHAASATFEIGDARLRTETARQLEVGVHWHGQRIDAKASVYTNHYADFIYLADTGLVEDGLPVRQWSQHDAWLRGAEAEATAHLAAGAHGHWDLRLWGDAVRARLTHGHGNLPRMPALRLGAELRWQRDDWRASIGATRYFAQDEVAAFETRTAGFTLVGAHLAWAFANTGRMSWEAFADASNLANHTARLSTSLIKDAAPLPGRALSLGIRGLF